MDTQLNEYASERANLLARLVLTSRKDVHVAPFPPFEHAAPLDLLVQVSPKHSKRYNGPRPYFGVQILYTTAELSTPDAANRFVKKSWKPTQAVMVMPVVLFVFSVSEDKGYFSWVFQPHSVQVPEDLHFLEQVVHPEMQPITKDAINELIDEVLEWFAATYDQLVKVPQAK